MRNFKDWFKNSMMVNRDGSPMIFYHGTNNKFDTFSKDKIGTSTDAGWLGSGFYFYTNEHDARQYGDVKKYYLNIENLYIASDDDNERLSILNDIKASKKFTDRLKSEGYDGVYYNGDLRGETVVFEPEQIWHIDGSITESLTHNSVYTVKEIISILNKRGIEVSKRQHFYNGSGYIERYSIIGSPMVDSTTDYMNIPIKRHIQGFITKKGILQNFFYHNGEEFEITKNIGAFIMAISN